MFQRMTFLAAFFCVSCLAGCGDESVSPPDGDGDSVESVDRADSDAISEDGEQWEDEFDDQEVFPEADPEAWEESGDNEEEDLSHSITSHGWDFTGPYLVNDSHGSHVFSPYKLAAAMLGDMQIVLWTSMTEPVMVCSQKSSPEAPWKHYAVQYKAMFPPEIPVFPVRHSIIFAPMSKTRLLLITDFGHMAQFERIGDSFMPVEDSFHYVADINPFLAKGSLTQLSSNILLYVVAQSDRIQTYAIHTDTHEIEGPHTIPISLVQPSTPVCNSYGSTVYPAANHTVSRLPDGTIVIGTLLSYTCREPSSSCQRYAAIVGDAWNQWRMGPVFSETCVANPTASTVEVDAERMGIGLAVQGDRLMVSLARNTRQVSGAERPICYGDCSQGLYFGGIQQSALTAATSANSDGAGFLSLVDDSVPAGYADLDCPNETLCSIISYTDVPDGEDNGFWATYDLRRLMLSEGSVIAAEPLTTIRLNRHIASTGNILRNDIHTVHGRDTHDIWIVFQPDYFIAQSIAKHFQCSADGSSPCEELTGDEDLDVRQQPGGRNRVRIAGFHPDSGLPLIAWGDATPGKALWFDTDGENSEQPLWSCLDPAMQYMSSELQTSVAADGSAVLVLTLEYRKDPNDVFSGVKEIYTAARLAGNLFSSDVPVWHLLGETSMLRIADLHIQALADGMFMAWWIDNAGVQPKLLFSIINADGEPSAPRSIVLRGFDPNAVGSLSVTARGTDVYILQSGSLKGQRSNVRDLYFGVFDAEAMQWKQPVRYVFGCDAYATVLDSVITGEGITALIRCSVDMHIVRAAGVPEGPWRVERTWRDYFYGYSEFGYQATIQKYRLVPGKEAGQFMLVFNLEATASSGPSHKSGLALSFIDLNVPSESKMEWPDGSWLYLDVQQWNWRQRQQNDEIVAPEFFNSGFSLEEVRQGPDGKVYITYLKHPHLEIPYSLTSNNYVYMWVAEPL